MKVTLRRLLSRLTALALTTSAPAAVLAAPGTPASQRRLEEESNASEERDEREIIGDLAVDLELIDPRDAAVAIGRSLALAIENMRPIAATQLAATWALASDPVRRLAVANALEWYFPLVGDDLVIDHLSYDPDPEIRAATARAAWARRATGGDAGVLPRLADDPDPKVRSIARKAKA